jgi:hypothetical protein
MNLTLKNSFVPKAILLLGLFCLGFFLISVRLAPSIAQSSEERELEDKIPKHLPIKVKIKKEKEKAFKDLKNEKWVRDLELEVTNTGDKPIYLLRFILVLPEITDETGRNVAFTLHYGRDELGDVITKAAPDDIPINPGETHVFKIYEGQVLGWESFARKQKKSPPKKIDLKFQMLSFGDGTGFIGTEGTAIPRRTSETSSAGRCDRMPNKSGLKFLELQHAPPGISTKPPSAVNLPADFWSVNFSSFQLLKAVSFKPYQET